MNTPVIPADLDVSEPPPETAQTQPEEERFDSQELSGIKINAASVVLVPGPSSELRLAAVKAAQNPLLEAAKPLLRALADMPVELDATRVMVFHRLLEREVMAFQALCSKANIQHEHAVAASYALCTALDESASGSIWGGAKNGDVGVWAGRQLATQFHDDHKGGEKVFLLIGRLASSPREHVDLLEMIYLMLGLGFEGRYSTASDGQYQLETIRQRLYTMLVAVRGEVPSDLSPHWRGEHAGRFKLLRSIPVWFTVLLCSLVSLGLIGWYKYRLMHMQADVEARIAAIGKLRPPPAPAPVVKPLRLKELLSAEIARGTVSVDEDDRRSAVTFKGDDMFVRVRPG